MRIFNKLSHRRQLPLHLQEKERELKQELSYLQRENDNFVISVTQHMLAYSGFGLMSGYSPYPSYETSSQTLRKIRISQRIDEINMQLRNLYSNLETNSEYSVRSKVSPR